MTTQAIAALDAAPSPPPGDGWTLERSSTGVWYAGRVVAVVSVEGAPQRKTVNLSRRYFAGVWGRAIVRLMSTNGAARAFITLGQHELEETIAALEAAKRALSTREEIDSR